MVSEKYIAFIEKLIEMTKRNALAWSYLDTEPDLCKGMEWTVDTRDVLSIFADVTNVKRYDDEESFVCRREGTYIVLFMKSNSATPSLYVIPHTYKSVAILKPDEYGEYITRLYNLVKSGFPQADTFIDTFLSEE